MCNARNQRLRLFLICLLILTLIFVVLYRPFLFEGRMYAYNDIGGDTIHQYLPQYAEETDLLINGGGGGYSLHFGLGRYVSGLLTKYLNPANVMILLFGKDQLHLGLITATYVKYVMICLFSLLYFLRILKNEKAAAICALLWTFSGYNVLWGQHYQFLSAMVGFSACMYGFQLYLEDDGNWYVTVPLISLMIGLSYYFTYISAWFLMIYGVLFLVFQRKGFRYILKKVGVFLLVVLLTVGICASYWVTAAVDFFASNRTNLADAFSSNDLFYPVSTLMAFAARFISTDLIGAGNSFSGPVNYYEAAILSVSLLFVFSVTFLMLGKRRWRTFVILAVSIVLLCMPLTSRLLCFNVNTQRWAYLLSFLQTIAIGTAFTEYLDHADDADSKKRALTAVLIGDGLLGLIGFALITYHYHVGGGWLEKSNCITVVCILLLYHAAFLLLWKKPRRFSILLGVIALELVVGNYATVNQRGTITVEQWYQQMYNDGTQNVVQWIQEQDDSIYRINKTYYSVCRTDSLIQGYNGMGSYISTNSAHLVNLVQNWNYTVNNNWLGFDGKDWLANDMLGVKYVISKSGSPVISARSELIYDDGKFCVYRNADWSGFGYLCYEEMAESSLADISREQKAMLLTHYYYRTGNDEAPSVEASGTKEIDLLPYLTGVHDCEITETDDGIVISGTGIDAQLHFAVPDTEGWTISSISVEMDVGKSSHVQLFAATEDSGYSEAQSTSIQYKAGRVSCSLVNPVDKPVALRLDPTMAQNQTIKIRSIRAGLIDLEQLRQQQELQLNNKVTDLVQKGSTFTGMIMNPADSDAMLCMPIIYSEFWKAKINGADTETVNINGGLVGIVIPSGTYTFELCYDDTIYTVGKMISWCAIALYLVLVFRQKHKFRLPMKREA